MSIPDTVAQKWTLLPNRLRVSYGRVPKGEKEIFTLEDAAQISGGIVREAAKYEVNIEVSDPPIVRFVKYVTFLSRKYQDGSCLPTNEDYHNIVVGAMLTTQQIDSIAEAQFRLESENILPEWAIEKIIADENVAEKAPYLAIFKPLPDGEVLLNRGVLNATDFMDELADRNYDDIVRDVLQFRKRRPDGSCEVTLLRFDEYGKLEPVDDIVVPGKGWIRTIGDYGYPLETQEKECAVENIEGLEKEIRGYFYMFPPKKKPDRYMGLVAHSPGTIFPDSGLLHMSVRWNAFDRDDEGISALRIKRPETLRQTGS